MSDPAATSDRRSAPRAAAAPEVGKRERVRGLFRNLGPGLVTGAADDDPSGIATYSQAGAAFGYGMLWTSLITLPLMIGVQLMCARIGLVARRGLASVLREHYSRWLLWFACLLLLVANTFNIAADLGAMAASAALITGVPSIWFVVPFTALVICLLVFASYERMTNTLKWLTLVLFAYVVAAFLARPDWSMVARGTFLPRVAITQRYLLTFVGILGTTISPYLFFWQAAHEVEAEESRDAKTRGRPRRAIQRELRAARTDTVIGMSASNIIMYFIVLTTGATLNVSGQTDIQTAEQAAAALRPMAGPAASLLFTIGIIGTGLLAVPVLAGSAAYAVAEAGEWRRGMDQKPRSAMHFYGVIIAAMLVGMVLNFLKLNAIKLLFWAAILNGALAPPLIIIIIIVCNNREVMGSHTNDWRLNALGGVAGALMSAAAIALVVSWFL